MIGLARNLPKETLMENPREGFTSIYIFLVTFLGAFGGAIIGMALDAFVAEDIVIGLLAGLLGIVAAGIIRGALKRLMSPSAIDRGMAAFPRIVWINAIISAVVSGLAGHDLSHEIGESSPAIIGGFSGLFATILMVLLMWAYFSGYAPQKSARDASRSEPPKRQAKS